MSEEVTGNVNGMFPGKYMKPGDLEGQTYVGVIDKVVKEEVGQDKELKNVLYFKENEQGLVLNKTRTLAIALLHGEVVGQWKGKAIAIKAGKTKFGSKIVDCIDVDSKVPATTAA